MSALRITRDEGIISLALTLAWGAALYLGPMTLLFGAIMAIWWGACLLFAISAVRRGSALNLVCGLVTIVLTVGFPVAVLSPSVTGPHSRTRAYLSVVNTLRQVDGAKQQYAIDHQTPPETVLSREQLLEYLPERFWDSHATYKINALREAPEAVLPAAFDGFPAGTIIRLQPNMPPQIVLPNH